MNTRIERLEKSIDDLFCAGDFDGKFDVEKTGRMTWRVNVNSGSDQTIDVELGGNWLTCRSPVPASVKTGDLWRYLEVNPRLAGRARVALSPEEGALLNLCEDVPVVDGVEVAKLCAEAIENLISSRAVISKPETAAATNGGSIPEDSLEDLCEETGWVISKRQNGEAFVDLDTQNASRRAGVETDGNGGYRLRTSVAKHKSLCDESRAALAEFLLTVNGLVRFARAGVDAEDGVSVFYEVRFNERPSSALLDSGLSSLSVACRFCDKEALILADGTTARRYLEARGTAPRAKGSRKTGEPTPEPARGRR